MVVLLLAAVMAVAAGCRTDVAVVIAVDDDGAGVVTVAVTLDAEAAEQLGDPANLALDDLRSTGWEVQDAEALDDGGVSFVGRRAFGSADELAAVLDEVGGADGVFRDTSLAVADGFASRSYSFRTGLELTGDPAQFGDSELTQVLGGLPLGRTPEELTALGADAPDAGTLSVSVDLPGDDPDTNGTVRNGRAAWSYPLTGGTATSTTLSSSSAESDAMTMALVVIGAVLLAAAVIVTVVGLVRTRRRSA